VRGPTPIARLFRSRLIHEHEGYCCDYIRSPIAQEAL
jgi:hypothetical protein